ncbi:transglutaminase family protein [Flavobacterium sp.]|uniref:transglutaminase-like domain-containing protein n=1 Tax=Flavobacterium sp. TaxID=239 RepID=UPI00375019A8
MNFKVLSTLSYDVLSTTTFFFNIMPIKSDNQLVLEESLIITPAIPFEEFKINQSDTRFIKMEVEKGTSFTINYKAQVVVNYAHIDEKTLLKSIPIINLDPNILPYFSPSRHCESDKLMEFAINKFGFLLNDYSKALAIEDWIYTNITYTTGSTNSSASATETLLNKAGVCKDFAHLGIALCRALDIPARYFTGYACYLNPPDFHACFEAYIGGHWIIFDPTKLAGLNGLVKIANGKDASEAAVASYFGDIICTHMDIQCHPVSIDFMLFDWKIRREKAFSY